VLEWFWRVGDGETGRRGDGETGRQGDKETRRQGDKETRRQGDKETRRSMTKHNKNGGRCDGAEDQDAQRSRGVPVGIRGGDDDAEKRS